MVADTSKIGASCKVTARYTHTHKKKTSQLALCTTFSTTPSTCVCTVSRPHLALFLHTASKQTLDGGKARECNAIVTSLHCRHVTSEVHVQYLDRTWQLCIASDSLTWYGMKLHFDTPLQHVTK